MIRRSDYTDEEWVESLARCKVLTEGHVWKWGDFFYIEHGNNNHVCTWTELDIIDVYDDKIWFPRLDQLVRHEQWNRTHCLRPTGEGWTVWDYDKGEWGTWVIVKDHVAVSSTPELAALQAIQRCEKGCDYVIRVEDTRSIYCGDSRDFLCAGIHPQHSIGTGMMVKREGDAVTEIVSISHISLNAYDGPHHCLEHAMEI